MAYDKHVYWKLLSFVFLSAVFAKAALSKIAYREQKITSVCDGSLATPVASETCERSIANEVKKIEKKSYSTYFSSSTSLTFGGEVLFVSMFVSDDVASTFVAVV